MGMVPRHFDFPGGVDIYASLESAKEVGGDLYDLFLQGGRLYFCIGDVAGKGIPAALFMSVAVNMFRMVAKEGFPPAYIATRLNDALSQDNENGMFVTMFIGEIDLSTGHMDFCNAGHNPPVIIDRPLSPHEPCRPGFIEMEPNAPIGLWPELEYVGEHVDNMKGKKLFLYTDGLNEAENKEQQQYGEDRLQRQINQHSKDSAQQTIEDIQQDVTLFVNGAEASDDMTILCLTVR
jgi:serine phosphatase RsbU (regulator of sigma subunit)